jgi:hypothetical protein
MSMMLLVVLILVLPQVELPETAFHGGTAPVSIRARVNSAPVLGVTFHEPSFSWQDQIATQSIDRRSEPVANRTNFVPILLCTLLC